MAVKLGIIGLPNTGKSFSRRNIEKGEEVFVIAPSRKNMHLKSSDGQTIKQLNVGFKDLKTTEELMRAKNYPHIRDLFIKAMAAPPEAKKDFNISGNWVVCKKLSDLEVYLKFVDKMMPHIKTIILPDFTHFVSEVIADQEFIKRKAGGEAFQRFWELAGDTLNNFIASIDELRDDLIVVTEYHAEYNEVADMYEIFVPAGKMLKEKFLPDSYYDYMLYTHVNIPESGEPGPKDYKFVTRRVKKYNARTSGLFQEAFIPNDLNLVLTKMREQLGI
jgi:hypothetical protein